MWNILHRTHWIDEEKRTIYVVAEMEDYLQVRELLNEDFCWFPLFGLNPTQERVWNELPNHGDGATVGELASKLKLPRHRVYNTLKYLKSIPLVEEEKRNGRRNYYRAVDISTINLPSAEELVATHEMVDQEQQDEMNFDPDPIPSESERITLQKLFGDDGDDDSGRNVGNLGNEISTTEKPAQCDEAVCCEKPISKISKMQENQANAGFYLGNPPFSNIFQFSNIGGSNDPPSWHTWYSWHT